MNFVSEWIKSTWSIGFICITKFYWKRNLSKSFSLLSHLLQRGFLKTTVDQFWPILIFKSPILLSWLWGRNGSWKYIVCLLDFLSVQHWLCIFFVFNVCMYMCCTYNVMNVFVGNYSWPSQRTACRQYCFELTKRKKLDISILVYSFRYQGNNDCSS